jgi:large subunit ribosomal protein L30
MEILGVVRIRGQAGTPWRVQLALEQLKLTRTFNTTIIPSSPDFTGLLREAEPYLTWGELEDDVLKEMLSRCAPNLSQEESQEIILGLKEGKMRLSDINIRLPLRLHPPSGGFKGKISRSYRSRGEFGYRGRAINALLKKMM